VGFLNLKNLKICTTLYNTRSGKNEENKEFFGESHSIFFRRPKSSRLGLFYRDVLAIRHRLHSSCVYWRTLGNWTRGVKNEQVHFGGRIFRSRADIGRFVFDVISNKQ